MNFWLRILLAVFILSLPQVSLGAELACQVKAEEGSQIRLLWNAVPGKSYSILTTTNLAQSWQSALTESSVLTATTTQLWQRFSAEASARYFRIQELASTNNFREGVSRNSVGRFGGKAGNDNAKINTLLTFLVDPWRLPGVSLYWPHYASSTTAPKDVPEYGYYTNAFFFGQFGPVLNGAVAGSYSRIVEAGWEHMDHELKANGAAYQVNTSLLTPGVQFVFPTQTLVGLFYNLSAAQLGTVRAVAVPTADGLKCHSADANGYLSLSLGESMTEGWLLVWFNGARNWSFDMPCLISVQHRPSRLELKPRGLELRFAAGAGTITVLPLWGIERLPLAQTQSWVTDGLPEDVITRSRFWNQAVKTWPKRCQEFYQAGSTHSTVDVQLRYSYAVVADDWATEPLYLAPIQPVVGLASERGYSVTHAVPPEFLLNTLQGPYSVVTNAHEARYTLPTYAHFVGQIYDPWAASRCADTETFVQAKAALGDFYDSFLSGWNPANNPSGADLGQKIYPAILSSPYLGEKSQLLIKQKTALALDAVMLASTSFTNYVDGVSGKTVPINTHSYLAYGREIQDADWYHAYALYASWAAAQYFGRWDIIRNHWDVVANKLLPILEFSSDWSTQCWWANSQGIGLGAEDINMGFGAMVALARICQHEGAADLYDECLYMMAKTALTDFASHFSQAYVDRLKPWRNKDRCLDSDPAAPGDGWSEPFGVQFARGDHNQGLWLDFIAPYNPCWPEVAWLFAETGISQQATNVYHQMLPQYYPDCVTNQSNEMWGNVKILLPILGYLMEREPRALFAQIQSFYAQAPESANYTPWAYAAVLGPTLTHTSTNAAPPGVTFFPDYNFTGVPIELRVGNYSAVALSAAGLSAKTLSSLQIPAGYSVLLWENGDFSGKSWPVLEPTADLSSLGCDNAASSAQIFETQAAAFFYPNASYGGLAAALPPGDYVLSELETLGIKNDALSSLKVMPGHTVTLYADDHFGGTAWSFSGDTPRLNSGADNAASSLKIH